MSGLKQLGEEVQQAVQESDLGANSSLADEAMEVEVENRSPTKSRANPAPRKTEKLKTQEEELELETNFSKGQFIGVLR